MLPYASPNMRQRAEHVLQNTEAIGCHGYLTPSSLVFGNPCLNLASAANLFNTWLGLEFLDEQEANDFCAVEDFDAEGQRKVCAFTIWLNSLIVELAVFDLFEDLRHGLVVLQTSDKISPGSVIWHRVLEPKATPPTMFEYQVTPNQCTISRFDQVEDTDYVVELGNQNRMHLVRIQGADVVDASKMLGLSLV